MRQGWSGITPFRGWGLGLVFCLASPALPQDPATDRVAREASNQAAEADRLFKKGDFAAALPLYQAERVSRAKLGDVRYEAYAYRAIGCCLGELGEEAAAIEALKAAKVLDLKRDDPGFAGYDDLLTARALSRLDHHKDAIGALEEALPRLTQSADRDHQVEARLLLARSLKNLRRLDEASAQVPILAKLLEGLDLPNLSADFDELQASLDRVQGRPGLAYERLSDAGNHYRANGHLVERARVDLALAETLVELGRFEAAESGFSLSADESGEIGDDFAAGEALLALATIRLDLKSFAKALEAARLAEAKFREVENGAAVIQALVLQAQALEIVEDRVEAGKAVAEALVISNRVHRDQPPEIVRLRLLAADLAERGGNRALAESHLAAASRAAKASKDSRLTTLVEERRVKRGPAPKSSR